MKEKEKVKLETPNLSLFRESLFWDTDISKIKWLEQSNAVIRRVFERGNETEKNETYRFYGRKKVKNALRSGVRKPYTLLPK